MDVSEPLELFELLRVDLFVLPCLAGENPLPRAQGGIQLKTSARALEGGAYGQSIRVRNDATKDVYEVTLTGPQAGMMSGNSETPSEKLARK